MVNGGEIGAMTTRMIRRMIIKMWCMYIHRRSEERVGRIRNSLPLYGPHERGDSFIRKGTYEAVVVVDVARVFPVACLDVIIAIN